MFLNSIFFFWLWEWALKKLKCRREPPEEIKYEKIDFREEVKDVVWLLHSMSFANLCPFCKNTYLYWGKASKIIMINHYGSFSFNARNMKHFHILGLGLVGRIVKQNICNNFLGMQPIKDPGALFDASSMFCWFTSSAIRCLRAQ